MTSSRYKIKQTPNKITLSAKTIRSRLRLLLACRDLVILLLVSASTPNSDFEPAFNIILLIPSGLFFYQGIYGLLWQPLGREHIHIQDGILSHQSTLFGLERRRKFSLVEIPQWQSREDYTNTENIKITLHNYLSQGRNKSIISSPLRRPGSKQGAWSFAYYEGTIYIGEFFYSKDCRATNSELNSLMPKKAKTETLFRPENDLQNNHHNIRYNLHLDHLILTIKIVAVQTDLLHKRISNEDRQHLIIKYSESFSNGEIRLLNKILEKFGFDVVQAQALAQAVMQQVRFDPNAYHVNSDDEDTTGICPHCINLSIPFLCDYLVWRETYG